MPATGRPTENAFVERVIRTLKEEIALNDYEDFDDAFARIGQFLEDVYNTKRIHSALVYKTPAEYDARMRVQGEKGGQRFHQTEHKSAKACIGRRRSKHVQF